MEMAPCDNHNDFNAIFIQLESIQTPLASARARSAIISGSYDVHASYVAATWKSEATMPRSMSTAKTIAK